MNGTEASREFAEQLRNFCRAHRTGRRVAPEVARAALDWELQIDALLRVWPRGQLTLFTTDVSTSSSPLTLVKEETT